MRTSHSSTNTTPYRAVTAERTTWTTCNWYTGGATMRTMRTMRGPGTGRQRLEPDDEQSSRPVLRGLGLGNEARLPDISRCGCAMSSRPSSVSTPWSRCTERRWTTRRSRSSGLRHLLWNGHHEEACQALGWIASGAEDTTLLNGVAVE